MEEILSFMLAKFWEQAQEYLPTPLTARDTCQERQGRGFKQTGENTEEQSAAQKSLL